MGLPLRASQGDISAGQGRHRQIRRLAEAISATEESCAEVPGLGEPRSPRSGRCAPPRCGQRGRSEGPLLGSGTMGNYCRAARPSIPARSPYSVSDNATGCSPTSAGHGRRPHAGYLREVVPACTGARTALVSRPISIGRSDSVPRRHSLTRDQAATDKLDIPCMTIDRGPRGHIA